MRLAFAIVLVGCYAPHPQAGGQCADGQCPTGLVCAPATNTCELELGADAMSTPMDTPTLRDGCTPAPEICGNGIDEDCDGVDPPCAANDAPGGAIDVSAGGTFTGDLTFATDDAPEVGCGGDGGRDLFYKITLAAPEVIYLDTFGSSFGTIIRVIPGTDCGQASASQPVCDANACGGKQSQLATSLPTGTSCIVIDQHATDTSGALTLHVKRGGRDGTLLDIGSHTYTGTSCSGRNATQPSCTTNDTKTSEDVGYYFMACPAQTLGLTASTCTDPTMTHFDTVVYMRPLNGPTAGCSDDSSNCLPRTERPDHADGSIINASATGPNLFWLTVDGYSGACGGYRLDTNLN